MKYLFIFAISFIASVIAEAQPRHHFDAMNPDVHDPVMALGEDGRYYIFSTGMGISVMSSSDMKEWREEPGVFSVTMKMPGRPGTQEPGREFTSPGNTPLPQWTTDSIRGFHGHIWAPDISHHDGKWYLYYSCSTFGKNGSAIGLATNKTLDPASKDFKWEDQGCVIVSHKHKDNWNAIDPVAPLCPTDISPEGEKGYQVSPQNRFLFFGSFWDGIQIVKLGSDFKTLTSKPKTIARRVGRKLTLAEIDDVNAWTIEGGDTIEAGDNAIEAPFVVYNDGWYYLFVSHDYCCRGRNSTYKTVYGRSRSIEGPYLDKEGRDMAFGGGILLVGPDDENYGIGHCAAYQLKGQWYFISHAYKIANDGRAKLFIKPFTFKDGWIVM